MRVSTPPILLALFVLTLACALPATAAEATTTEMTTAKTLAALSCAADVSSAAEPALGTPEALPAQTTCGPCLLEFCPEVGVRCSFTGCGINDCCRYSCACDPSCVNTGTPFNVCRLLLPELCNCGDGDIDSGEECDDPDFGGATCMSLGFTGGTLACTSGCRFDTSGCHKCGNGTCESSEDCDSCPADCDSQTTGNPALRFCCGNGIAESAEGPPGCAVCDGNC